MNESLGNAGIGARLRRMRESEGLSLSAAAERLGFSVPHLSNVERGVRGASQSLLAGYRSLSAVAPGAVPRGQARISLELEEDGGVGAAADDFGTRLMRLRLARGWSLTQLARATSLSRSHLGNLETGRKTPSSSAALVCDEALHAEGVLAALADAPTSVAVVPPDAPVMAPYAGVKVADPQELWQVCTQRLAELRGLAQKERPAAVLPELARRGRMLASVAHCADGAALWLLAARYAEFAGWMAQEGGFDPAADQWTQAAARWATCGGDTDMLAYRWERRALLALYRGDARATVALAQQAGREHGTSLRMAGLARRREAQGYALAGDRVACERALDDAVGLLERSPLPYPRGASWGPNSIADHGELMRAACLVDLGAGREAAALFGPDPESWVPRSALRTRTRFMIRGALAFAAAGDAEYACALALRALPAVARLDSATFRVDVRRLIAVLLRHPRDARARRILPDLYNAIRVQ